MNEEDSEEPLPESEYNRILEWEQHLEKRMKDLRKKLPKDLRFRFRDRYAILDESGNVIKASLLEWAVWFEKNRQRFIYFDSYNQDQYQVSTVFLGLNHNYSPAPNAKPKWFETIVFGPPEMKNLLGRMTEVREDLWIDRCETLKEAQMMHSIGIGWLKAHYTVTHDGGSECQHHSGNS